MTFKEEKNKIISDYIILKNASDDFWKIEPEIISILDKINDNENFVTIYSSYEKMYLKLKCDEKIRNKFISILDKLFHNLPINVSLRYKNKSSFEDLEQLRTKLNISDYFGSDEYFSNYIDIRVIIDEEMEKLDFWNKIQEIFSYF